MKRTYKYRLMGNKGCYKRASEWIGLCCDLYNVTLQQRMMVYKQNKADISCFKQINQLPELKAVFTEYREVDSQVLIDVIQRVDRAYKAFFRRIKKGEKAGFPRFKGKNRYDSFTFRCQGWVLDGQYLLIKKIGMFKLKLSRPIEGTIKTVTIRRSATGKWYACFSCDNVPERKLGKSMGTIGIDVGIKAFCVDSEGRKTDNPLFLKQSLGLLQRRQRTLFRRNKGSNGRNKARLLVAKTYEKVYNQRNDFLHKLANQYIANYGLIYIEDLNIKGMARNRHLSRAIFDSSWGKFFELLSFKAEEAERMIIKVPAYNTSQICSGCGEKVSKTLAERIHACPHCGLVIDRDENAARNICAVGQTVQERTYAVTQSVS